MKILYVDEAGCLGRLPSATSNIQPVFVIAGVVVDAAKVQDLTLGFLSLKTRSFPGLHRTKHFLDAILPEIKGAELRREIASGSRNDRRGAMRFLDNILGLLRAHQARTFGCVWVKGIGAPFDGSRVYSSSMQAICHNFDAFLATSDEQGVLIADSRNKPGNTKVSHSIFTKKHSVAGDAYPRLVEMPTFGHSDNHAGLQLADLLCSGILFPMAVETYCRASLPASIHCRPYSLLRDRYKDHVKRMQFRYQQHGRTVGGLVVSDGMNHRGTAEMFA